MIGIINKEMKGVEKNMGLIIKNIPFFRCGRCGYEWEPRNKKIPIEKQMPVKCANCGTPHWNKPRVRKGNYKTKETNKKGESLVEPLSKTGCVVYPKSTLLNGKLEKTPKTHTSHKK